MRIRVVLLVALLTLLLAGLVTPVSAVTGGAVQDYDIFCDRFTVTYAVTTFDRDNTGGNAEAFEGRFIDGHGNELLFFSGAVPVEDMFQAQTETFFYNTAPTANPIRFRLVSVAGNGLEEQVIWDLTGDCSDLPSSGIGAPGIPAGFVFATIICDTPVYNTQSGQPVGDAAITAGQTWYVNPTPVDGDDGQQWTEIFVSSTTHPFIPTVCVQR